MILMLMSQRPHIENRYYPVLELATYLFIVLLLKVQETSVLNLLTRFPYSRDCIAVYMTLGLTVTLGLLVSKVQ